MKLKERREVSGELGMSSMTDILFILLMFFMMISILVHPSALNLSLPGSPKTTTKPISKDKLDDIAITESGSYLFNGKTTTLDIIKNTVQKAKLRRPTYSVVVTPDPKAAVEKVVAVLDMTQQLSISSILAADAN